MADGNERFAFYIERARSFDSSAAAAGAPPAGAHHPACAALLAAGWDQEGRFVAGGPRAWALPLMLLDTDVDALLDPARLGPGGHEGIPGRVAACPGHPSGALARALGAALNGVPAAAVCGVRTVADSSALLGAAAGLPLLVVAVGEGLPGEPESGVAVDLADCFGWTATTVDEAGLCAAVDEAKLDDGPVLIELRAGRKQ